MILHNVPKLALTALAFFVLASPALAQNADPRPAGEFEEEMEVSEVLLDVLVTDRDGRVILGLGPEDFVVEEDGEPVEVESVTFYSNSRLLASREDLAAAGLKVDEIPEDRYFILFFQDQQRAATEVPGLLSQQVRAGKQTQDWIREEMLPSDWAAVVSYGTSLKIHRDFTHDKQALLAAVDDAIQGRKTPGTWPSRLPGEQATPSLRAHLPQGKKMIRETKTIYDGLRVLAEAVGEVKGRKNLVFFGLGFGDVGSFGQYQPDTRYFRPTARALNDNNVAVYTLDMIASTGARHTFEDALNHLALETGGEYYSNFTSFTTPLESISEATNGYYLLSYRSRHPKGEEGFQEVKVDTRSDEFKVKARQGYLYGA